MREIRGDRISMIFQQPDVIAQPGLGGRPQIEEVLRIHRNLKGKVAQARTLELLRIVGIPDPQRRLKAFPHELSGGMAQRVMIAMALACEPELLIADEPTTALDVTIQAQILDLMRNLRDETGTAIVLITHDLGVVAEMCDRVAVMYAGEIVEQTDVTDAVPRPAPPVHARAHRLDPGRRRGQGRARRDPRQRPESRRPAARLPVRAALRHPGRGGHPELPRHPPRAPAHRTRPRRPLLALPRAGRAAAPRPAGDRRPTAAPDPSSVSADASPAAPGMPSPVEATPA
jgi:ABC-type glutathione transport system ATPase component